DLVARGCRLLRRDGRVRHPWRGRGGRRCRGPGNGADDEVRGCVVPSCLRAQPLQVLPFLRGAGNRVALGNSPARETRPASDVRERGPKLVLSSDQLLKLPKLKSSSATDCPLLAPKS